ncbi:MAG: hypothetical protein HY880_02725, partial [Deltaproteobacteria bacterium]|nr:hypothetical protein [Deltaproteobacteria bacterium]
MGKKNKRKDTIGLARRFFYGAVAVIKISLAIISAPMLAYAIWLGYEELLQTSYLSIKTIS